MNSLKRKKNRCNWDDEDLRKALEAVSLKKMTCNKASKMFGMSRRTLQRYITANIADKSKLGAPFTLKPEQEKELCSRIFRLADIGFPITCKILRLCVYKFCATNKIKHKFSVEKKVASFKWARNFLKHHSDVSQRKSQNLNPARAQKLNKFIVADHFKKLFDIMYENNLVNKPGHILNMDEKGCQLNLHKEPRVLARKGARRVHIIANEHGENVTVVSCANAAGAVIPPMILFKGKRMKPEFLDDLPPGSVGCMTDKGSMTCKTFVEWLHHLGQHKPRGKCLLIFDGANL